MKYLRLNLILLVIIFCFAAACQANKVPDADVREPAVAGKFYPDSAAKLKLAVEKYLQDAIDVQIKKPVAIVVPHAGYIFSGQICADGFKPVGNQNYDVVVILGTKHTSSAIEKVSLYPGDGFRTPLGVAMVDKSIISALKKADLTDCTLDESLHETEHSIEVIVPFVQVVFPKAKIVPVVVGSPDAEMCARFGQALARVLKDKKALIVASSDLSHYPSAAQADIVDRETLAAIAGLDPVAFVRTAQTHLGKNIPGLHTGACGEAPIMAAMVAAKSLGANSATIVSYAHSGNTSMGDKDRVVGYGAVVFTADGKNADFAVQPASNDTSIALKPSDKKEMLAFARETISRILLTDTAPLARRFNPRLQQKRGVFVTLKKHGMLRGCIGRMVGDEPVGKLVGTMAIQAAFNDRRFSQVTADELKDIEIEISLLTPMKQVAGAADILVGRDGVLLHKDMRSAVFLPQVATEQGWSRDEMLDNLCRKAGLDNGCWKENARLSTFQDEVFSESQFN